MTLPASCCMTPSTSAMPPIRPNMQLWGTHNPFRACLLLADGHLVLWEYGGLPYLSDFNPLVREVRTGGSFFFFCDRYTRTDEKAAAFAGQVDELMRSHAGTNRRLAVDKIQIAGLRALEQLGIDVREGEEVVERTRVIKGPEEIKAMRCAIWACEASVAEMRKLAAPGMTENDVWAELHKANIRRGGEWIENPYPVVRSAHQSLVSRSVARACCKKMKILALDTDMIGCYGMCADISRQLVLGRQPGRRMSNGACTTLPWSISRRIPKS